MDKIKLKIVNKIFEDLKELESKEMKCSDFDFYDLFSPEMDTISNYFQTNLARRTLELFRDKCIKDFANLKIVLKQQLEQELEKI